MGTNGLPDWGVTATGLTTSLGNIITAEKAANPAFSNFNTLANNINGIKSAKITASVSGDTTTVTVVNTKPITDFTIKVALGKVTSATCDGAAIPSSKIKQDALTSSWYVTQTIGAGTHTFVISSSSTPIPILPVANFGSDVSSGYVPLAVKFTDSSTNAESWLWNFDDGTTSILQHPEHVFTTAKTYNVTLTASNANGANSKTSPIVVSTRPVVPTAAFTASATTITFTDKSGGAPTSWLWDFGDGSTAATQNSTHTYSAPGTYTVKLTVTNTAGDNTVTKTMSSYVVV
jgi:PKD repeat protein